MKHIVKSLVVTVLISHTALAETAVEWAPFVKAKQITTEQLLTQADKVNREFLSLQAGFIKRELVQKSVDQFADIIHWESLDAAQEAAGKVESCTVCIHYFSLMDSEESAAQSNSFAYYQVIQRW